jgi:hypothetical protein
MRLVQGSDMYGFPLYILFYHDHPGVKTCDKATLLSMIPPAARVSDMIHGGRGDRFAPERRSEWLPNAKELVRCLESVEEGLQDMATVILF